MSKKAIYNIEARDALKVGVDALANAVKVTLGPKGRHVVIDQGQLPPKITKDGVTVAHHVELEDYLENMGAQMIKEVASKTADISGDGTTTATVLAQAIITAGLKNVAAGANPMDLKRGIDKAVRVVVDSLKSQSQSVGDDISRINQIATISANGDELIGSLITEAMNKVGKDGIITIEDSKTAETEVKIVEGMQIPRGYISPYFVTNQETMEVVFEDCQILIYDKKIVLMRELIPLFEKQVQTGKPLLIIAEDLEGEALASLIVNNNRGSIRVAAIKSPGFGDLRKEIAQDIAVLTGGKVVSEEKGNKLEEIDLSFLGAADKIVINKGKCTIIGGHGAKPAITNKVSSLKTLINSENTHPGEVPYLKDRLAKLSGGVAILYVGAASDVEMKEKIDRVNDALHATRAAVEEGIVAGGGVAFIRAIEAMVDIKGDNDDETTGIHIIRRAIEEPLRQICENAGVEGSVVVQKVREGKGDYGYNARTEKYEHLIKSGVIDPTKVGRVALENAASIAAMLLTTECVLVNNKPT